MFPNRVYSQRHHFEEGVVSAGQCHRGIRMNGMSRNELNRKVCAFYSKSSTEGSDSFGLGMVGIRGMRQNCLSI